MSRFKSSRLAFCAALCALGMAAPFANAVPVYAVTDLGTLGNDTCSASVNNSGEVAGWGVDIPAGGFYRAFRYSNGAMSSLSTLGGNIGYGSGINDVGQVVGTTKNINNDNRATLWNGNVATDLGTLGGAWADAQDINNSGQVAGSSSLLPNGSGHAFLYSNGVMTDLGTLGGTTSQSHGINASGQVVGDSYLAGDHVWHAFVSSGGVM